MELLMRLMKDGKVVGYEKHEGGEIYHKAVNTNYYRSICQIYTYDPKKPYLGNYIEHNRKDLYTGITVDGQKVFENDYGECDNIRKERIKCKITWEYGQFSITEVRTGNLYYNLHTGAKYANLQLTGISGVKEG